MEANTAGWQMLELPAKYFRAAIKKTLQEIMKTLEINGKKFQQRNRRCKEELNWVLKKKNDPKKPPKNKNTKQPQLQNGGDGGQNRWLEDRTIDVTQYGQEKKLKMNLSHDTIIKHLTFLSLESWKERAVLKNYSKK